MAPRKRKTSKRYQQRTFRNIRWLETVIGQVTPGNDNTVKRDYLSLPDRPFKIVKIQYEVSAFSGPTLIQFSAFNATNNNDVFKDSPIILVTGSKIKGTFSINSEWFPLNPTFNWDLLSIKNKCLNKEDDFKIVYKLVFHILINPADLKPVCP